MPTPISWATMPARVVLPRPGGPANSRWSAAWPRRRAASRTIARCSLISAWPTNSSRRAGAQAGLVVGDLVDDVGHGLLRRAGSPRGRRRWARRAHGAQATARRRSASRSRSAGVALGQVVDHPADLVGAVAEAGEGLGDVAGGPTAVGRLAVPARRREVDVGQVEAGLELDQQAGRGLLAHAGHQAQGADVLGRRGPRAGPPGRGPRGWPGPGRGRRRGRRAAPRSRPAPRGWRSRRASGRPRGCGGGPTGRPRRPARPPRPPRSGRR